ncbi:MAG: hypothetical protein RIQ88_504 [Actinomycetota bacterium]
MADERKDRPWLVNYFGSSLIWGSSFLFIAFANHTLPPIGVAFWRCFFGALTLLSIILIRKLEFKRDWKLLGLAFIVGTFNTALPFTLFAFGEHHVSSAFAGMANAITPIATVIALLTVFRSEKVTKNQIIGLLVGVIGAITLVGAWNGLTTDYWPAVVAVLLAGTCYGFGGPFIRKFITPLGHPPEVAAFGQIAGATLILAPIYFTQPLLIGEINTMSIVAILVLGIFGTGIAYTLYYPLLKQVGSAISSSVSLLIPLIAVSLGVIVLNEQLKWYEPVGGLIILFGAAIAQGVFRRRKSLAM